MKNLKRAAILIVLILPVMSSIPAAHATVTGTRIYDSGYPVGLAEDQAGNIYIADEQSTDVSKRGLVVVPIATGTLFGQSVTSGTAVTLAAAADVKGIAVSSTGVIFYSRGNGDIYALSGTSATLFGTSVPSNTPTKVASTTGLKGGLDFDSAGNLYGVEIATGNLSVLPAASGNLFGVSVTENTSAIIFSGAYWFWDLAVDSNGNVFIADGWGQQGVFVLPKTTGTLFGQSVTANTFTRITTFGTARYAGIDVDVNDVLYANVYASLVKALSGTTQTIFQTALTANVAATLTGTSGYVNQGLVVAQNGDLISGAYTGTFRLVATPTVTVPGAPTIGTATALSPTSALITFLAPASNGGATIETYTTTSSPSSIVGRLAQSGSGSITISGLTSSTAYTFRVTASNSAGISSASSATASITMPASDEELAAQNASAASAAVAAAKAAAEAAAAKREAERKSARAEISTKFEKTEKVTIDTFKRAEIAGVTAQNIDAIQAEILALGEKSRGDLLQVIKIARKYEVVGKIASTQVLSVQPIDYIEIGLIPDDSKNKIALSFAVRKLPEEERSNFMKIKAAIDSELAKIQERKDRLAALFARSAARYTE